ncbi:hypothetical protein E4T47_02260 [Aureobasidium subglaciale]|nr:hypothetical protein E4T43_00083 [Aureobasidium subglaciale]KAI5274775.1 hypothetical protein E4T47_02260 [Aureobasidium subglaciale]
MRRSVPANTVRFTATIPQTNQQVERECHLCGKMRGIYDFSATQRRKGDEAACLKCIPELQNIRAGPLGKEVEDDSDAKYLAHVGENNKGTTVSGLSKSGGVRLPTSSVSNKDSSVNNTTASARPFSGMTSTTNISKSAPRHETGTTGWAKLRKGHRDEIVPDLADDDVETFDDDESDFDM